MKMVTLLASAALYSIVAGASPMIRLKGVTVLMTTERSARSAESLTLIV